MRLQNHVDHLRRAHIIYEVWRFAIFSKVATLTIVVLEVDMDFIYGSIASVIFILSFGIIALSSSHPVLSLARMTYSILGPVALGLGLLCGLLTYTDFGSPQVSVAFWSGLTCTSFVITISSIKLVTKHRNTLHK